MKKYLYKLSILLLVVSFFGCDLNSQLEELNVDTKNPSEVPGEPLFTNGVREMFDLMNSTNVNENVFRLYAQYWAQTTYPDESQYNQVTRNIGRNMWRTLYRNTLKDISGAKEIISLQETVTPVEEAVKKNKLAVIDITEVYAYSTLVDIFGNVPFTEALDIENPSPKYDDAATIYTAIIAELDAAIASIDPANVGFDNADPIYNGDMAKWLAMANSLKLRLALRLADVDPATSKTMAEQAASGVIADNGGNFGIQYTDASPNTNPLWVDLVASGRKDFIPSSVLTDYMNNVNDPRRPIYFSDPSGVYSGGVYGDANASSGFSQIGDIIKEPDLLGTILSYSETEFLLAEAVERGYAVGGTAEEHYDAAIKASMDEWGVSTADADAYLLEADVAYTTAPGAWKQKIGSQKWLAMYNMGFEGWTAWRLLDFTGILVAPPDMSLSDIPTRFIYPIEEAVLNGAQLDAAATAIGGDLKSTKIFWDKN
ncbi:SusD/RagB family nutrient-binding outer membrane lipoprotein [Ancylomarina longa]|uniref:SusD/RagB family nutrient-binding outer membrane lipoprotein n=1 Tax=Ancylomarina longa TaxID=2487017 RepID=A0A434ATT0_9BACT|nr:SusD/RagB family nutrient-binding outer membrane lipoprotein [Ancylomarina longa]RUT77847.1 SusD/RagB family nutrient-binding outer membrane lipoprotein [Ancylomarina longa]